MRLIDADKLRISVVRENGIIKLPHISLEEINCAQTYEAIPRKWINNYLTDIKMGISNNNPVAIQKMLKDWEKWEKENEK